MPYHYGLFTVQGIAFYFWFFIEHEGAVARRVITRRATVFRFHNRRKKPLFCVPTVFAPPGILKYAFPCGSASSRCRFLPSYHLISTNIIRQRPHTYVSQIAENIKYVTDNTAPVPATAHNTCRFYPKQACHGSLAERACLYPVR